MAEMLVMTRRVGVARSIYQDAQMLRRGDVVAVRDDGFEWSWRERGGDDHWVIVRVVDELAVNLTAFTAPGLWDGDTPNQIPTVRAFALDMDKLGFRRSITADKAHGALKVRYPTILDPEVFA